MRPAPGLIYSVTIERETSGNQGPRPFPEAQVSFMTANKVRADYDSLKQIAQVFSQQAQATQQTLQQIKQDLDLLQQGDWVGKSADRLYGEMTSALIPSVTRLQKALESASRVTTQISGVMKQAEDDSARVLRGDGGGAGAPQTGGISTGQPVGPSGGSVGGSEGISTGQPVGPSGGSPARPASGPVNASGSATRTAADRMLKDFDPKVAEIVEKSPTLTAQLEKLERQGGWTIVQGTPWRGSYTNATTKTITIDGSYSAKSQAGSLAHEVSHAVNPAQYHEPTPSMTRKEYVRMNVDANLHGEGLAELNRFMVRDEIISGGGPDVGVVGHKSAEYEQVYADYEAGTIKFDEAVQAMADISAGDVGSHSGETYRDHFRKKYGEYWDEHIAPDRKK
jgi:WXG100 family type VII secretion target